jgi:hypothetical protein
MVLLGACLMVLGCGRKEAKTPGVTSPNLEAEVARVEPMLLWGCDMPTEAGRSDCSGDGMSMAGRWLLDGGPDSRVWEAVKASIGEEGRPWRAPDRVGKQPSDSFSRDGFLGLLESTVAMKDKGPLEKVWAYAKRTGKLCPDATDGRCDVTPGVSILAREVLGEFVGSAERVADEATMTAEAIGAPGNYRAYLVARKIHLKARLGTLTRGYCHAVVVLRDHFPKNVFFRVVDAECGRGAWQPIAEAVSRCLGAWKNPGKEWTWNAGNSECIADSQGHELVSMAKYLLGGPVGFVP